MHLHQITIENFRNYSKAMVQFTNGINCIRGPNGAGKTNLLDAIYYLSTGKSYFNPVDLQLIKEDREYFSLKGFFDFTNKTEDVFCVLVKGRRKIIKRNDIPYSRLAEHYGEFPSVMVAPGDVDLINGGSEGRRNWLDSTISLIDKEYLDHLIKYEKTVANRNSLLKKIAETEDRDLSLLNVYDEMMEPATEYIFNARKNFLKDFQPEVAVYDRYISGNSELIEMKYISELHDNKLSELLEQNLNKDIVLQRTSSGVHKDDMEWQINSFPIKKFGSQGQQKTFLLGLKLAQHQFIKSKKGITPLLLLDDVAERLDETRLNRLFELLDKESFGQVFLTDTSAERTDRFLKGLSRSFKVFDVQNGEISIDSEQ